MKSSGECGFSDEQIRKMANDIGLEIQEPVDNSPRIKVGMRQIDEMEKKGQLQKLGTGFVRFAHRVWELKKEGDDYYLERKEEEKV